MWGVQWGVSTWRNQGREEASSASESLLGLALVWPLGALWNLSPMPTQQTLPPRGAPGAPALPLSGSVTLGQSLTLLGRGCQG